MICSTADFFFSFKEADDAVLCARPGMTFHRRAFPKASQGAMVSFKGVSCHGSSPVGHGLVRNCTIAVAYFPWQGLKMSVLQLC